MTEIVLHSKMSSSSHSFEMDVSFTVEKGDFVAIYGDSGAGKTTLLRMIAGLTTPDSGKITIDNACWYDSEKSICLAPQKRKVGMVFQDYALFPNMTVRQNLDFALQKNQTKDVIEELIDIFELGDIQNQKSTHLSGGQKQRVALARALVQKPEILLLDEPLSALDDKMRQKLQGYILNVHQKYALTTFLVSHDLAEIFSLSNKVIKLDAGKVIEAGTPESLFLDKNISGKYKVVGTVLSIQKTDEVHIASVLSGQNLIKIMLTDAEKETIEIGDKVMVVANDFNPILVKI